MPIPMRFPRLFRPAAPLAALALLTVPTACVQLASAQEPTMTMGNHNSIQPETTIAITATGEVMRAPDIAHISTGVQTEAETASEAMAMNREAMNGVFGTLGVQGTVTAAGIDSWVGVTVLILLAVSATLQLVASSADNGSARTMVTVSLVGSVLATCFSLYACTQLGGPVGPHIGLGIAVVAAAVATTASVRRLGSLPAAA